MTQSSKVCRWVVRGILTTVSPLAIHSGFNWQDWLAERGDSFRPFRQRTGDEEWLKDCDALVAKDYRGLPYIPGSALKGSLRAFATRSINRGLVDRLFGKGIKDDLSGGICIFDDSFLANENIDASKYVHLPYWDATTLTYVEQHTAIDRRTSTANHGSLFNEEVVPSGFSFPFEILIDDRDEAQELRAGLARSLAGFTYDLVDAPIQLGSGSTNGWGRMSLDLNKLVVSKWDIENEPKRDNSATIQLQKNFEQAKVKMPVPDHVRIGIELDLSMTGPFLVCDPSNALKLQRDDREYDHVPRFAAAPIELQSLQTKGECKARALLPASAAKGSFRSQLERIIRTIQPDQMVAPGDEPDNQILKRLLGHTGQQSGWTVTDFVSERECVLRLRDMVAIDRWSGSVAGSAKFDSLVFEFPQLSGTMVFVAESKWSEDQLRAWLGLIAFFLRDLREGDVSIGFGDTKGFSRCIVASPWKVQVRGPDSQVALLQKCQSTAGDEEMFWVIAGEEWKPTVECLERELALS